MSAAKANPNVDATNIQPTYDAILTIVRQWPAEQRFTLIHEVLQTLAPASAPHQRKKTLADALGMLKTDGPPPTDEEVQQIIDEARWEKYGR